MTEPSLATIAGIADAVARGETTASAVVADHLDRAAAGQDTLNAFTMLDADGAMTAAADIDARRTNGEPLGPLAGVPVAIKDLIDQAGLPTTCGGSFPPIIPTETAPSVTRLQAADAVVIGRTGLHEFAFGFSSENHWFGPVRNPWDTNLSPGGSSGGSGAAVSAGLVPGALGTDTGGSVRVPAALCGIVGLKVTHGRVSLRGVYPLAPSIDTVGPLARSVADVELLFQATAGDDPADPWAVPMPVAAPRERVDLSGLRLGVPHPWVDTPLASEVHAGFDQASSDLVGAGAEVVDVDLTDFELPGHLAASVYFEVAAIHRQRWHDNPEAYGPEVSRRLADVFTYSGDDYLAALAWRRRSLAAVQRAFTNVDLLITPTVAALRKPIGHEAIEVGGRDVSYRGPVSHFTAPVNHLGLPALALPLDAAGHPPPSLQLIGPAWSESKLLAVGRTLEAIGLVTTRQPPFFAG